MQRPDRKSVPGSNQQDHSGLDLNWYWERLGWQKEVNGVVYFLWQGPKINHTMLAWRGPGRFEKLNVTTDFSEEFHKQDDGWFKVDDRAWYSLRDGNKEDALDAMDRDMELHVNELITVQE